MIDRQIALFLWRTLTARHIQSTCLRHGLYCAHWSTSSLVVWTLYTVNFADLKFYLECPFHIECYKNPFPFPRPSLATISHSNYFLFSRLLFLSYEFSSNINILHPVMYYSQYICTSSFCVICSSGKAESTYKLNISNLKTWNLKCPQI